MYKSKIVIVAGLTAGLLAAGLVLGTAAEKTTYWSEVSRILKDMSSDMKTLGKQGKAYGKQSESKSEVLKQAKEHENNAYGLLKQVIQLGDEAPNISVHAKTVNVVSSWYLATQLWKQGLKEDKRQNKKLGAIEGIMSVLKEDTKSLVQMINKHQDQATS